MRWIYMPKAVCHTHLAHIRLQARALVGLEPLVRSGQVALEPGDDDDDEEEEEEGEEEEE